MQIPDPLKNIDLHRTLRQRGIKRRYSTYRKNYESAKELVKKNLKQPEVKTQAKQLSSHFTNEVLDEFAAKRIHLVDVREANFKGAIVQYLAKLEQKVLSSIRTPKALRNFVKKAGEDLFDEEDQINTAIDIFTPLLRDIATVSGTEALRLVNANGIYIPKANAHALIRAEVEKFATSLLETDRERLTTAIEDAFNSGASVPEVQAKVSDLFDNIKKYQSERIARTELLRASNFGQLDAYKQSEVVSGTQWLVDGNPCPECEALDGQIISLDDNWFDQGDSFMGLSFDYGSVDAPPLHPNCECTIVPVLEDLGTNTELSQEVAEMKEYISELEKLVGIHEE